MSSERQEYNENTPWWGEHIHRYNSVYKYVLSSDKILDIACGNGFGSFMLSQKTNNIVIGGDISIDTIIFCKEKFDTSQNLKFQQIDGTSMEFENGHFDLIVSFETIEHTTKFKEMIYEFYRTIKNKGLVIVSTPNQKVTSPSGVIKNPYHTQEFNYEQLSNLLNATFDDVKIFGQQYIRYSKKKSLVLLFTNFLEKFFYSKGIRKIPIAFQNKVFKFLINKNIYPSQDDFELTETKSEILKCKTFFAVCKKN